MNKRELDNESSISTSSDESNSKTSSTSNKKPKPKRNLLSAYQVFKKFIIQKKHPETGDMYLDASGVCSKSCYDAWLNSRYYIPENPELAFQRALCCHVSGTGGREPFSSEEEDAVIKVLRSQECWPCFKGSNIESRNLGSKTYGFHEKIKKSKGIIPIINSLSDANQHQRLLNPFARNDQLLEQQLLLQQQVPIEPTRNMVIINAPPPPPPPYFQSSHNPTLNMQPGVLVTEQTQVHQHTVLRVENTFTSPYLANRVHMIQVPTFRPQSLEDRLLMNRLAIRAEFLRLMNQHSYSNRFTS